MESLKATTRVKWTHLVLLSFTLITMLVTDSSMPNLYILPETLAQLWMTTGNTERLQPPAVECQLRRNDSSKVGMCSRRTRFSKHH